MMGKPSEAAIREACRRTGCHEADVERMLKFPTDYPTTMLAASLIEKFEPDTLIDPVTKRAREIYITELSTGILHEDRILAGTCDSTPEMLAVIRALKEGMPK